MICTIRTSATGRAVADRRRKTRLPANHTVVLDIPVRLTLRYELVETTSDSVRVYPDIYHLVTSGLRGEVRRALARTGIDTLSIDDARVGAFVSRLDRSGRAAAIESLLRHPRDSSDRKSGTR